MTHSIRNHFNGSFSTVYLLSHISLSLSPMLFHHCFFLSSFQALQRKILLQHKNILKKVPKYQKTCSCNSVIFQILLLHHEKLFEEVTTMWFIRCIREKLLQFCIPWLRGACRFSNLHPTSLIE